MGVDACVGVGAGAGAGEGRSTGVGVGATFSVKKQENSMYRDAMLKA